jgi:hypothetical protein
MLQPGRKASQTNRERECCFSTTDTGSSTEKGRGTMEKMAQGDVRIAMSDPVAIRAQANHFAGLLA